MSYEDRHHWKMSLSFIVNNISVFLHIYLPSSKISLKSDTSDSSLNTLAITSSVVRAISKQ